MQGISVPLYAYVSAYSTTLLPGGDIDSSICEVLEQLELTFSVLMVDRQGASVLSAGVKPAVVPCRSRTMR